MPDIVTTPQGGVKGLFGNVLIVAPYGSRSANWFYVNALKESCANYYLADYLPLIKKLGIQGTQDLFERIVERNNIQVIMLTFFADNFHFPLEFFARLRKKTKIVLWYLDDENYFDIHGKYYGQVADLAVTTDYFAVPAYARLGIPSLLYFSPYPKTLYHPLNLTRDIDVSFIGDCAKSDRAEFLDYLSDNGVSVVSYGAGSQNGYLPNNQLSNVISRTKINLNFTKMDTPAWMRNDDPLRERVRQNKGHAIEAALTRSFCLSEAAPSMRYLFEIGKEIDCFNDKKEMLEKVRYYLAHDQEREEMAGRAYARAIKDFEQSECIPKVLLEIHQSLFEPKPHQIHASTLLKSDNFKIRQVNVWTVCFLSALSRGKIKFIRELLPDLFRYGLKTFLLGFFGGVKRALDLYRGIGSGVWFSDKPSKAVRPKSST